MAAFASVEDVEHTWRELVGNEPHTAGVLIERVSALISLRIPDIAARIAEDPNLGILAGGVVVDAVLRVMRNPEGFTAETMGAYSYQRDSAGAGLYLTDVEWSLLLPQVTASGAFTIRPGP
jgi:hypothetical protein